MKKSEIDIDPHRLALGLMRLHKCSLEQAEKILLALKLNILVGGKATNSVAMQAAIATAVNCGARSFLGGVYIKIATNTPNLLPFQQYKSFNELIVAFGGKIVTDLNIENFTITFGQHALNNDNSIEVICNGWQAGFTVYDEQLKLDAYPDFATGGIAAGALATGSAFFKMTHIEPLCTVRSTGISLWRPDLDWMDAESKGPILKLLPKKFWMLGLGHLGQSYLWNLSMLPFNSKKDILFLLNDYDKIKKGNLSAGMLSMEDDIGKYKTRHCSNWLEKRGFTTRISERKYNDRTVREDDEPYLALCGFDNLISRRFLDKGGFDYVAESALGGSVFDFDKINFHTFPNEKISTEQLWKEELPNSVRLDDYGIDEKMLSPDEQCGYQIMLDKAVSTCFVGAFAASIVTAEILRAMNGGLRFDNIILQMRNIKNRFCDEGNAYSYKETARNGSINV
jgi:hypothetical protein